MLWKEIGDIVRHAVTQTMGPGGNTMTGLHEAAGDECVVWGSCCGGLGDVSGGE